MATIKPFDTSKDRRNRTRKVQRIASGLGAIGELFIKQREREEEARQQELDNRVKQKNLELQQLRIDQTKRELDQGDVGQVLRRDELLFKQEGRTEANKRREDLEALITSSDEESSLGLQNAFRQEHDRDPVESEVQMIDALVREGDANVRAQFIASLFPSAKAGAKGTAHITNFNFDLDRQLGGPERDPSKSIFAQMSGADFKDKINKSFGLGFTGEKDPRAKWPLGFQIFAKLKEEGGFNPTTDPFVASSVLDTKLRETFEGPKTGSLDKYNSMINNYLNFLMLPQSIEFFSNPPPASSVPLSVPGSGSGQFPAAGPSIGSPSPGPAPQQLDSGLEDEFLK